MPDDVPDLKATSARAEHKAGRAWASTDPTTELDAALELLMRLELQASRPDLARETREAGHALDVLWAHGQRRQARALLRALERRVTTVLDLDWRAEDLEPRVRVHLLHSRLALREGNAERAYVHFCSAQRRIRSAVGGNTELRALISCRELGAVGELYGEALVAGLDAARAYSVRLPRRRIQIVEPLINDALRMLQIGSVPPTLASTRNLITSVHLAIGERNDPADESLLNNLERLAELPGPPRSAPASGSTAPLSSAAEES